jgi:hypothetical protein
MLERVTSKDPNKKPLICKNSYSHLDWAADAAFVEPFL